MFTTTESSVDQAGKARVLDATTLVVNRWSRYGRHRLYVNTVDGQQVGWVDLDSGERVLSMVELADTFDAVIAAHNAESYVPRRAATESAAPRRLAPSTPHTERDPGVRRDDERREPEEPWTDLAANMPGQAARARAQQELAELRERKGAFLTLLARGLDAKTDERSWRVGADGEETVGARLEKLRTDGWQLLHSVPVGKGDSDIDHLLIGPGGVVTINTKTHPNAHIWVGRTAVLVNGHKQPYLRNSRFEAARAATLLSRAVGWTVEVTPALVFLTDTFIPSITIKDRPEDVLILDRRDVPRYFRRRQPILTPGQVEQLFDKARRSTTWR